MMSVPFLFITFEPIASVRVSESFLTVTVLVASSQPTSAPNASAINLTGTKVLPLITKGATSLLFATANLTK